MLKLDFGHFILKSLSLHLFILFDNFFFLDQPLPIPAILDRLLDERIVPLAPSLEYLIECLFEPVRRHLAGYLLSLVLHLPQLFLHVLAEGPQRLLLEPSLPLSQLLLSPQHILHALVLLLPLLDLVPQCPQFDLHLGNLATHLNLPKGHIGNQTLVTLRPECELLNRLLSKSLSRILLLNVHFIYKVVTLHSDQTLELGLYFPEFGVAVIGQLLGLYCHQGVEVTLELGQIEGVEVGEDFLELLLLLEELLVLLLMGHLLI